MSKAINFIVKDGNNTESANVMETLFTKFMNILNHFYSHLLIFRPLPVRSLKPDYVGHDFRLLTLPS